MTPWSSHPPDEALVREAIALYQTAGQLLDRGLYTALPAAPGAEPIGVQTGRTGETPSG